MAIKNNSETVAVDISPKLLLAMTNVMKYKNNDNNKFIKSMISKMIGLANIGVAFNFLQKTQFESNLAEYDKKEIYRFCKKNFKNVKMFDNYLGSEDVTILISKEKR